MADDQTELQPADPTAETDHQQEGPQEAQAPLQVAEKYELPPLLVHHPPRRLKAVVIRRRVVPRLLRGLPALVQQGRWIEAELVLQSLLILHAQDEGTVTPLLVGVGTGKLLGVVRQAAAAGKDSHRALKYSLELLLGCVCDSEAAADATAESDVVRLLLALLKQRDVPAAAKQHAAAMLAVLATSPQLVYRDILQGAGVMEAVLAALTDAGSLADLILVQELLWVLVGLTSEDPTYHELMLEMGTLQVLTTLFAVFQTHIARPELRPLAAQMLRVIHLLVHDNDVAKERCRELGLLRRLADQLRLDMAAAAEPGQPLSSGAVAAAMAPHHHHNPYAPHHGPGGGSGGERTPPHRNSSGGSSAGAHHHHAGGSLASMAIPEEEEVEGDEGDGEVELEPTEAEADLAAVMEERESLGARLASVAGPPETLLALMHRGPGPATRAGAAELLRRALGNTPGANILAAGVLLPEMPVAGLAVIALGGPTAVRTRLSLSLEATSLAKALLVDSPANQLAAASADLVPCLAKLLNVRSTELASEAAEAISQLGTLRQKLLAAGTLEGLVRLMHECLSHVHEHELMRLNSLHRQASLEAAAAAGAAAGGARQAKPAKGSGFGSWWRGWGSTKGANGSAGGGDPGTPTAPRTPTGGGGNSSSLARGSLLGVGSSSRGSRNTLGMAGRQRPAGVQLQRHCLVCALEPGKLCPYCPLSAVVKALSRVLGPEPAVQEAFVAAGGIRELMSAMAPAVAQGHWRLLASLVQLASVALQGCQSAQDELRFAGGLELLSHALAWLCQPGVSDVLQLRPALLRVLRYATEGNPANRLAFREQGGFTPLMLLLSHIANEEGAGPRNVEDREQLDGATVDLLAACLPGSPGNQDALHRLGATDVLLAVIKSPSTSTELTLAAIRAMGLLADGQAACQQAVTDQAGVPLCIGILAESGMPTTQQVCLEALVRVLRGNRAGREQALALAGVPLGVRLLREAATYAVAAGAADLLAILAGAGTAAQGEVATEGGLPALLEQLEHCSSCLVGDESALGAAASAGSGSGDDGAEAASACVACLHALCCVVADNSFTKNVARQQGALGTVHMLLRANRAALGQSQLGGAASGLDAMQRLAALQLQVLTGAVLVVANLVQSNHANQDAVAGEGVLESLASLLVGATAGASSIADLARTQHLLAALARALGSCGEFHPSNKALIRETGAMGALARLPLLAAEQPDLSTLGTLRVSPAVAAACAAVAALGADDEESQRALMAQGELLPALFRLAGSEDPALATQAARGLEFLAIRNDIQDDAEDRPDFEQDTIAALVRLLSRSGTGTSAATGASAAPPSAAAVREASTLLALIAQLSDLDAPPAQPAVTGNAGAGGALSKAPSLSSAGSGATVAAQSGRAQSEQLPPSTAAGVAPSGGSVVGQGPGLLPMLITDHSQGLAMLRTFSAPPESGQAVWNSVVGRSAPVFQRVVPAVSEGAWKPFKVQVSWMLFLLAAKSAANREQVAKLQRTSIAPLAQQLENAERYRATIEAEEVAAAAEAAASGSGGPSAAAALASSVPAAAAAGSQAATSGGALPVSTGVGSGMGEPSSPSLAGGAGAIGGLYAADSRRSSTAASSTPSIAMRTMSSFGSGDQAGEAGGAGAGEAGGAGEAAALARQLAAARQASSTLDGGSDMEDEWSMLQKEVLLLGGSLPGSGPGSQAGAPPPGAPGTQ